MSAPSPAIVDNTFVSPRACGPCSFCCFIAEIRPLDKPAHAWCRHNAPGGGCSIHASRPDVCRNFQCIWTFAALLDDRWRPDNCRFMMRSGPAEELVIEVHPDFPDAWKQEPFFGQIKTWATRRAQPIKPVLIRSSGRVYVVFPEGEVDLGPEQAYTPIQSGYVYRNGRNQPYAHYGTDPDPPPAPAGQR